VCECGEDSTPEHVVLEWQRNRINEDGTENVLIVELREELRLDDT